KTSSTWPPPGVQYVPYYLRAGGRLTPEAPEGRRQEAPDGFDYDPRLPVPTIGGNLNADVPFAPAGAYVQRCWSGNVACDGADDDLAARADVLTYQTEPLGQDLEVVGPLDVELWAASSAAD